MRDINGNVENDTSVIPKCPYKHRQLWF